MQNLPELNNNISLLEKNILSFEWELIPTSKEKYVIIKQMIQKYFPHFENDSEDMNKIVNTICKNYYDFIFEAESFNNNIQQLKKSSIIEQKNQISQNNFSQQSQQPKYLKELSDLGYDNDNLQQLLFEDARKILNKYVISNQLGRFNNLYNYENLETFISNNFNDEESLDDVDYYLINKNINPLSIVDFKYEFQKEIQDKTNIKIQLNIVLRLGFYLLSRYKQFIQDNRIQTDNNFDIYVIANFFINEFDLLTTYQESLNRLESSKNVNLYNVNYEICNSTGIFIYALYFGRTIQIQDKIAEELEKMLRNELGMGDKPKGPITDGYGNPLQFNIEPDFNTYQINDDKSEEIKQRFGGMIGTPEFDMDKWRRDPVEIAACDYHEKLRTFYTSDEIISYNYNYMSHEKGLSIFKEYDYKYPNPKIEAKFQNIQLSVENIKKVFDSIQYFQWTELDYRLITEFNQIPLQYVASYEAFGQQRNFMNYKLEDSIKEFIRLCYWINARYKVYRKTYPDISVVDFYINELELEDHPKFKKDPKLKLHKWLTSQKRLPYFVLAFSKPMDIYVDIANKLNDNI